MNDENILPQMIVILLAIIIIIFTMVYHVFPNTSDKFIIKNYEGIVTDVDSEKITFDNKTILFVHSIEDFDWILNMSYNITVEYWNTTKNSYIKEVKLLK